LDAFSLWVQTKAHYFHPERFRLNLNNCIQALRNVTFVLQKAGSLLPGFAEWYDCWQERMRADPLLKWLVEARNVIVKQGDLKTHSTVRLAVVDSWFDPPTLELEGPPFILSENFARFVAKHTPTDSALDVGLLRAERRWVDSRLPDHELLNVLVHCFAFLSGLLFDAHEQLIRPADANLCDWYGRQVKFQRKLPPCMLAQEWDRTIWVDLKTGEFLTPRVVVAERAREDVETLARHYPSLPAFAEKLRTAKTLEEEADVLFEQAKNILLADGYHLPMAFLGYADGPKQLVMMRLDDRPAKHLISRRLAADIEKTGACSVIFICEMWTAKWDETQPYRHAGDVPDREEVLSVIALSKAGHQVVHDVEFTRDVDARIVLRKECTTKGEFINFLQPLYDLWNIHFPSKPE